MGDAADFLITKDSCRELCLDHDVEHGIEHIDAKSEEHDRGTRDISIEVPGGKCHLE